MSPHLSLSPQINRFGKSRDRAILVTDQHLYKLDPRQQYRVMRALPLSTVSVPSPTDVPRVWEGQGHPLHPGLDQGDTGVPAAPLPPGGWRPLRGPHGHTPGPSALAR